MSDPVVTVIVVSYNTREMTLTCLRSIAAQTETPHEVIVVDNDSTDGSAEAIAAEFPQMRLFAEGGNRGFAAANNQAAAEARGDYLLLLNPDTVVLDKAIDRLLGFAAAKPEARIWGGRTLFADGSLNPSSCWRRIDLWNVFCRTFGLSRIFVNSSLFNAEAYGDWDRGAVREVDIVTGCFLLIARRDWAALGGFDLTFSMYGEEADLCLRARRDLGAAPHVTPEATIIHHGGASEPVRVDKTVRVFRAKCELIKRHLPRLQRRPALALFEIGPLMRRVGLALMARAGQGRRREGARLWGEVWKRRDEWKDGFG